MQEAVVALIVLVAAAYASWSLMPRAWREALRRRWAPGSAPSEGRACSSCNDCGACGPSPAGKAAPGRDGVHTLRFVRPSQQRVPTESPPR
jgi:hypothetical protein